MKLKVEGIEIARRTLNAAVNEYHEARLAAIRSGDDFEAARAKERYSVVAALRDRVMGALETVAELEVTP